MEETETKVTQKPNRHYKTRIFELVFSNKKELLELYNAVNGTDYQNPDELEINTLENAIYLSMHNDLSFIIDSRLSLYEHQSTYNPNMPLRCLMYVADLYSAMTKDANLYGSKVVKLPTPRFLVFYNGEEECSEKEILRLSDAYIVAEEAPSLELKVEFLNINPGKNEVLLKASKTLKDYSEYTYRVRKYAKMMDIADAVERAISECIQEGVLAEFLSKNRAEAKKMSIYEYDEEKQRKFDKEEGIQLGEERFAELTILLMKAKRSDDILRAAQDKDFRENLYKEFRI